MTCLSVIAAAALLLSPMQSLAQNLSEKAKGPGKAVQQQQVDSRLAKRLQFAKPEQKNTPFKAAKKQVVKKQGMKRAGSGILLDDGRTIWGDWEYDPLNEAGHIPGMYATDVQFTNPTMFASFADSGENLCYGSACVDGVIYGISYYLFWGLIPMYDKVAIDVATGTVSILDYAEDTDCALETATDPTTGITYGEFLDESGTGFVLASIDAPTWTRNDIAPLQNTYVGLGATSQGQLYGVATDGNLYKIDKSNGAETLVGSTGLTLSNEQGQYYMMSGDIDPADDTFFFNGINANTLETGLYFIDLETGAATIKGYDVGQIYALMAPPAAAVEGAPARAIEVGVEFQGETTEGSISFQVPATTATGAELTGDVAYQVLQNGAVLAEGTAAAGAVVTCPIVSNAEGMQFFTVILSNAAGTSAPATVGAWIGIDVPSAATDVNAAFEGDNVTVTWTAPEAGTHGGFQGNLTYNVYRYVGKDTTVVAKAITECTFSETLPEMEMNYVLYGVEAQNEKYTGAVALSNGKVYGNAYEVPYVAPMTAASANLFTIIDSNDDGRTWSFEPSDNTFRSMYHSSNKADDWLITPPIRLEAGKSYSFNVVARSYSAVWGPETMEVKMGNAATAEAMTTTIVEPVDLPTTDDEFGNEMIRVEETGDYYFGIHSISEADMYYIVVSHISVEAGLEPNSPKAVENLTVIPDAQGELKATVSFVAPTQNVSDENIEGDVKAQVLRDKEVVGEVTVAPGAEVTFVDAEGLTNGVHMYQVIPFVGENRGVKSKKVSAFIGFDVPSPVKVTETLNPSANKVNMTWEEAKQGENGGLVLPEKTYYKVYSTVIEEGDLYLADVVDSVYAETNTEFAYATETGENRLDYWAVLPGNSAGDCQSGSLGSMFVGKPITLPFIENFAGKTIAAPVTYFMSDNTNNNYSGLAFSNESSDGDGTSIDFISTIDNTWLRMAYGKFSAANGAVNPVIVFDYQNNNEANNAYVMLDMQNGKKDVIDLPNGNGWQTAKVSLKNYANERYVVPYICANFVQAGDILVDNIMVFDMLEYALVASIEAPKAVEAGQTTKVTVKVKNLGENAAKGYTVHVYAGDEELALDGAEFGEIKSLETAVFTANFREDIFSDAKNVTLKAVVDYNVDLDPDNNVAETSIKVNTASLNGPENVAAVAKENGVHVSWTVPEMKIEEKTESFEDKEVFKPFSVGGISADNHYGSFGEWSLYDANGISTYSWNGVSYENAYGVMAYQVLNPAMISESVATSYPAATGEQYLISFCVADGSSTPATDHWLISPQLSGAQQTISFNLRVLTEQYGAETYEVLASNGGIAPSEFSLVKAFSTTSTEYENVEVTLPAGTTHFAIRHTAQDIFGIMIDDVKFTVAGGVELKGYKVYVDRVLVAGLPADVKGYVYPEYLTNGTHEFSVSGVLANGMETKPVSVTATVNNAPTAIESIIAKGEPFDVYTVDGVAVRRNVTNVEGLKAGVYVINNKKVVIK